MPHFIINTAGGVQALLQRTNCDWQSQSYQSPHLGFRARFPSPHSRPHCLRPPRHWRSSAALPIHMNILSLAAAGQLLTAGVPGGGIAPPILAASRVIRDRRFSAGHVNFIRGPMGFQVRVATLLCARICLASSETACAYLEPAGGHGVQRQAHTGRRGACGARGKHRLFKRLLRDALSESCGLAALEEAKAELFVCDPADPLAVVVVCKKQGQSNRSHPRCHSPRCSSPHSPEPSVRGSMAFPAPPDPQKVFCGLRSFAGIAKLTTASGTLSSSPPGRQWMCHATPQASQSSITSAPLGLFQPLQTMLSLREYLSTRRLLPGGGGNSLARK